MKTINLDEKARSVEDLLSIARREVVLLISKDGTSFVLEEADGFEREAAELGNSDAFMKFLEDRSREEGATPIEKFAVELGSRDA